MYLKAFHLFNAPNRKTTDLRDYEAFIWKCVKKVMPNAEIEVHKRYYLVLSEYRQTNDEARRIGKLIGKTPLGKLAVEHFYGNDKNTFRSGKIFIEAKNVNIHLSIGDEDENLSEQLMLN